MEMLRFFLLVIAILVAGYFIVRLFGGLSSSSHSSKRPVLDTDDDRFRNSAGELTSISITGEIV